MIFTAFLDEADTHGPSPTIVMAAVLGHTYQWHRVKTQLARIRIKHGFNVFHAKEFKATTGEFTGWSYEQKMRLMGDFEQLIERSLTEGIAVHLEHERYIKEYRAPPIPRKMSLDSQYGVCFRACLARITHVLRERSKRNIIHIVLEHGHPNANDCERVFNEFKRYSGVNGCELGTFSLQDKQSCGFLMIADLLAATYSLNLKRRAANDFGLEEFVVPPTQQKQNKGRLAFIELAPGALTGLKEGYEQARQLRIDHWRTKKAK